MENQIEFNSKIAYRINNKEEFSKIEKLIAEAGSELIHLSYDNYPRYIKLCDHGIYFSDFSENYLKRNGITIKDFTMKKKYEFKNGDFVHTDSPEECKKFIKFVELAGYEVAGLWEYRSHIKNVKYYTSLGKNGAFSNTDVGDREISKEDFIEKVTQHLTKKRKEEILAECDIKTKTSPIINKQTEKPMKEETIIIPAGMLRDGYTEMSEVQKEFVKGKVNPFTGECKKSDLIDFHKKVCSTWKAKLEEEFDFLKKEKYEFNFSNENGGRITVNGSRILERRNSGSYSMRGFWLNSDTYDWNIVEDDCGHTVLTFTKKQ